MSATTPPIGAPNSAGQPTTIRDQLLSAARDTPDLIAIAKTADPDLAAMLTGKSLAASKTPWVNIASMVLTWGLVKYGLTCAAGVTVGCWTPDDINMVAGLVAAAAVGVSSYVMRYLSPVPITSVLPKGAA